MNAIEQRTSHAIAWLRLPLMVGVVLLHNQYTTFQQLAQPNVVSVLSFLEQTLNLGVLRVCVPFFFLISGYLIVSSGGDDARAWPQKMKRRFFTLFVPYVCWGSLTLLAALALHQATWHDVLPSFWNYHGQGTPLHFQFWFLRDLMCLSLVYPLWVWLAKGTRSLSLGVLLVLYLCNVPILSLFYFCLGISLRLGHLKRLQFIAARLIPSISPLLLLLLLMVRLSVFYQQLPAAILPYVDALIPFPVILLLWRWAKMGTSSTCWAWLGRSGQFAFFLYAFHEPLFGMLRKKALPLMDTGVIAATALYVLLPCVIIGISWAVFRVLQRFFPRLLSLLTGRITTHPS